METLQGDIHRTSTTLGPGNTQAKFGSDSGDSGRGRQKDRKPQLKWCLKLLLYDCAQTYHCQKQCRTVTSFFFFFFF
jgi:hypothetical protein